MILGSNYGNTISYKTVLSFKVAYLDHLKQLKRYSTLPCAVGLLWASNIITILDKH